MSHFTAVADRGSSHLLQPCKDFTYILSGKVLLLLSRGEKITKFSPPLPSGFELASSWDHESSHTESNLTQRPHLQWWPTVQIWLSVQESNHSSRASPSALHQASSCNSLTHLHISLLYLPSTTVAPPHGFASRIPFHSAQPVWFWPNNDRNDLL